MEEKKEDPNSNLNHDLNDDEHEDVLTDDGCRKFAQDKTTYTEWWTQLRQLVLSLVKKPLCADGSAQTADERRRVRKRAAASFAAFLLVAYFYYSRRKRTSRLPILSMCLAVFKSLVLKSDSKSDYRSATDAPLSLLMQAAKVGGISQALLVNTGTGDSASIAYKVDGVWRKSALPPNNPSFQSNLLELLSENGCADVSALPESIWSRLATPALAALPFVYLFLTWRMMRNLHGKDDAARIYQGEESWQQTTFENVAGMDAAVREVSEVVDYLSNPTRYHGLGARPPRGILLHGPPGLGKTLLARAVAGEAQCNTFVACSGSDFVDMYVGRGAARVRKLFDNARTDARRRGGKSWWRQPRQSVPHGRPPAIRPSSDVPSAVIFIDEIDALAKSRSFSAAYGNNDEREQTLNQLLSEMDGFAEHSDVTMILIAATNRPDVLDPAFLRRFDRQIHVGYPNSDGRRAILLVHARRVNCDTEVIDWSLLASSTCNFSGADLRNVVNEAALLAVREQHAHVEQRHFEMAVERVKRMKAAVQKRMKAAVQHSSLPINLAM